LHCKGKLRSALQPALFFFLVGLLMYPAAKPTLRDASAWVGKAAEALR
jgi:hypothetical protein